MSERARDARGRFAGGMNHLFRSRASLHAGVGHPEVHELMNDELRSGRGLSSADARSEDEAPKLEGLDGGAGRSVDLSTPADMMNSLLRRQAGRGPAERAPNGIPIQD